MEKKLVRDTISAEEMKEQDEERMSSDEEQDILNRIRAGNKREANPARVSLEEKELASQNAVVEAVSSDDFAQIIKMVEVNKGGSPGDKNIVLAARRALLKVNQLAQAVFLNRENAPQSVANIEAAIEELSTLFPEDKPLAFADNPREFELMNQMKDLLDRVNTLITLAEERKQLESALEGNEEPELEVPLDATPLESIESDAQKEDPLFEAMSQFQIDLALSEDVEELDERFTEVLMVIAQSENPLFSKILKNKLKSSVEKSLEESRNAVFQSASDYKSAVEGAKQLVLKKAEDSMDTGASKKFSDQIEILTRMADSIKEKNSRMRAKSSKLEEMLGLLDLGK